MRTTTALSVLLAFARAGADEPKPSWEQNGCFALRENQASAVDRGMAAFAFNDWERAEKELRPVITSAPDSEDANGARGIKSWR